MPFDMHPYLLFYLVGSVFFVLLVLIAKVIFWVIAWLTKDNILNRNMAKMRTPEEKRIDKYFFQGGFLTLLFDATLSWINVVVGLWKTSIVLLSCIREILTSVPEEIKSLRFPLKNNPNLSRESVWAFSTALKIRGGERPPSEDELRLELNHMLGRFPSFDRMSALKQLESLNVISTRIISTVMSNCPIINDDDDDYPFFSLN